jgi:hypothetical protein
MPQFIHNPRQRPRIPVRCTIRVALRSGTFLETSTFNVGPGGCAIETTRRIEPGERAFIELTDGRVPGARMFVGRVAWSSDEPPWRCGIAFDAATARAATVLFSELVSSYPDALVAGDVERIPEDAVLEPTPVPGTLAVVPAEAEILQAIGPGVEASALRDRFGERWGAHLNALFALIERGMIEVVPRGVERSS